MQIEILIYFVIFKICSSLADLTFTKLHDNDAQGIFDRTTVASSVCSHYVRRHPCLKGFARAAHLLRQHRQGAKDGKSLPVVYSTAGDIDISFGEKWYHLHRWKILSEMMNAVRPDAMTLGKQELNQGSEDVEQFVQNTDFPIVVSNGILSSTRRLEGSIRKFCTLKIVGKKVGIIGYTTELVQNHLPGPSAHFPELAAIREGSETLTAEGVDIIIVLSSERSRHDDDSPWYTCSVPTSDTPEANYSTLVLRKNGRKVPTAHALSTCKYIGLLNATFDDKGNLRSFTGSPLYLRNVMPQEEDVLKKVNKHRSKKSAKNDKVIGMAKVLLEGGEKCRKEECVLGNLITESLVVMSASTVISDIWTTHSIGLIDGGSIKSSIDPRNREGKITYDDVLKAIPVTNKVIKFSIQGKYLKDVFEDIFKNDKLEDILQVSGLQITFDLEKSSGKRVVCMKARCGSCRVPVYENVTDKNTYNIVSTEQVLNHHDSLKRNHFNRENEEYDIRESVVWYIGAYSPVIVDIEGRITFSRGAVEEFYCTLSFVIMVPNIICTQYYSLFI